MARLFTALIFSFFLFCFSSAQSSSSVQNPDTTKASSPAANKLVQPGGDRASDADAKDAKNAPAVPIRLTAIDTAVSKTEVTTGFADLSCDSGGNIYLGIDGPHAAGIRKINAKGELVAHFEPFANPDMEIGGAGHYTVTPDGELYIWAWPKDEMVNYLLVFKSDGTYKSKIKLDSGFAWQPAQFATFPNGTLLMTGQRLDRKSKQFIVPFTGIFRADGKMLKGVALEEHEKIPDVPALADIPAGQPLPLPSDHTVTWGQVSPASDGNIYVMRWTSPASFYAVSPGGEVVKRFTVDAGDPGYKPSQMRIAANRIALLFRHPDTHDYMMKIVDLDGKEVETYDLPHDKQPKDNPLAIFGCYALSPERFTFLGSDKDYKIKVMQVEAR